MHARIAGITTSGTKCMAGADTVERVRAILTDILSLGARGTALTADSRLNGSIPEFDSMAVLGVVNQIEDEFGISVPDEDISEATFETVGSLADLVQSKL